MEQEEQIKKELAAKGKIEEELTKNTGQKRPHAIQE